jgi:hypothetical protein
VVQAGSGHNVLPFNHFPTHLLVFDLALCIARLRHSHFDEPGNLEDYTQMSAPFPVPARGPFTNDGAKNDRFGSGRSLIWRKKL